MNKFAAMALSIALTLGSVQAFAHAKLQSSVPASGAQLAQAPQSLTLNFSEEAQLAVLKLTSGGVEIPLTLAKDAEPSSQVTVPMPALKAGTYTVQWSAVAQDDGHVTKGTFSFSVKAS